jgi:hypothetical protein
MTDIIEQAQFEITEDRRIAALMRHQKDRDTLLKRAQVTEDLVTELKVARAEKQLDADALAVVPRGTIIRSAKGTIACRYDELLGVVFGDDRPFDWNRLSAPATLIWMPQ